MPPETYTARVRDLSTAAGDLFLEVRGRSGDAVGGLAYDSRSVAEGDLFFCIPGARHDGHRWAAQAVRAGAAALCVERPTGAGVTEMVVSDARRAMARIAARFYGNPADALTLLGVTGTNGKTTTTFLLESILRAAGHSPGLIGTIETRAGDLVYPGVRTTPESVDLHRLFREMTDRDVTAVAMEVTSHGLSLGRVEGLRFAAAAFTNLSQDHLDFHAGMDDYFEAKRSLFVPERLERGAVNVDDPYGQRLLATTEVPCIGFGISAAADLRAQEVSFSPSGTSFVVESGGARLRAATSLVGSFNVYNCLAAASVALQAGIDLDVAIRGLERSGGVPGRFEVVDAGQPYTVVVDYAHTPDSLDNVLRAARGLATEGRVLCVFGCGGDRDRGKRPLMGAVAARLADVVLVTSDNPRNEDPEAIVGEILEGVVAERAGGPDAVDVDREAALRTALNWARTGDVVVIAGKGHETGQEFVGGHKIPFDDREVARRVLGELGFGRQGAQ